MKLSAAQAPSTPCHKRLAVVDAQGQRASSTPPDNRLKSHLSVPLASPSSRHSSPGIDRLWNGRHYADDVIPRQLTASPIARLKDRDRTRRRLTRYHSFDHAVDLLKNAQNVVVLSGAGISTSLDIPDFRSDGGFYDRLSSKIGISAPEEFFSLEFFTHNSEAFWDNVKPLLPKHARSKNGEYQEVDPANPSSRPKYSKAHALLALLQARNQLLTNYTQNIDGLEFAAGVSTDRVIQCHGSWDTATCLTCGKNIPAKKYLPIVHAGNYPRCKCAGAELANTSPQKPSPKKTARKRKRSIYEGDSDHDSDDGTHVPKGLYKPDITFFGEDIPGDYVQRLDKDKTKADLLLILGTSLKVRPVKTMLVDFPPHIPQIWINRDRYSGINSDMPGVHVDIELLGECDIVIEELCRRAGLPLEDFVWKEASPKPPKGDTIVVRRKADQSDGAKAEDSGNKSNEDVREVKEINTQAIASNGEHAASQGNAAGESVAQPIKKVSVQETVQKPVDEQPNPSKPTYDIRVTSDIDAEWRWRISKKPAAVVNSIDR